MSASLRIHRLRSTVPPGAQPVAARLALHSLAADLESALPSGLPPQAILWLRRLALPVPAAGLARTPPWAWRQDFIQRGRDRLDAALQLAQRPALGPVPESAEAVLFADAAELLACLALAAQAGQLDRWWWRSLLARSGGAWQGVWARRPEAQAGARRLLALAGWRLGEAGRLPLQPARPLEPRLSPPALAARGRGSEPLPAVQPPTAQPLAGLRHAEPPAPPAGLAPEPSLRPLAPPGALPEPAGQLDAQSLLSARPSPVVVSAPGQGAERLRLDEPGPSPQAEGPAAAPPVVPLVSGRPAPQSAERGAGEHGSAGQAPRVQPVLGPHASPFANDADGLSPFDTTARRREALLSELPAVALPSTGTTPVRPGREAIHPDPALSDAQPLPPQVTRSSGSTQLPALTRTALPEPAAEPWPWPAPLHTRLAPLFFIVNPLQEDGLHPDFTRPLDLGFPVPLWAMLGLLAEAWGLRDEALQAALAEHTPPWQPPSAAELLAWAPASGIDAELAWPAWFKAWSGRLSRRLRRRLGWRAAQWRAGLQLQQPARLWWSAAELVVVFDLDTHDVAWRLAGLDRDPGWLPSAGVSLKFVFE